jgi:hypothetical protein
MQILNQVKTYAPGVLTIFEGRNKEMAQIEEDSLRTLAEPLSILEIHYQKTRNMWIGTIQI